MVAIEDKTFTSPKIVRVSGATDNQRLSAAAEATDYVGIPYAFQLPPDFFSKGILEQATQLASIRQGLDKKRNDTLYCSSLVWNAWYLGARVDLDSDYVSTWGLPGNLLAMPKSYFVMPDDIAMSDKVEYVIRVELPLSARVPSLTGLSLEQAQALLSASSLVAVVTEVGNPAPKGSVISQDPAPGSVVALGASVTVAVSNGVSQPTLNIPIQFEKFASTWSIWAQKDLGDSSLRVWYPSYLPPGFSADEDSVEWMGEEGGDGGPWLSMTFSNGSVSVRYNVNPGSGPEGVASLGEIAWGSKRAELLSGEGGDPGQPVGVWHDGPPGAMLEGEIGAEELKSIAASMKPVP